MRRIFGVLLCAAICVSSFAADKEIGYAVTYNGGSLVGIRPGQGMKLFMENDHIRFKTGKTDTAVIPAASVTEVSYGQDVHRRVGTAVAVGVFTLGLGALTALSKSKKHYIGVTWANGDQKGGLAMQCDKNDYRGILAALEGISGKKAVDSDAMTVKN